MSGVEPLAASAIGPLLNFGLQEPYKKINSTYESSKNLEYVHDLLNHGLQRLLAIKDDNERQVQRQKQKDTTVIYCSWKNRVSNITVEVDELRAKYERKRLPKWHFRRRSSLSKKMAQRYILVKELIEEGNSINIFVDKPLERVLKVLDAPKIMGYPTLQIVLKKILGCLKNKRMKAIGVYGMKGVGKSTIMQNLNNSEEVSELFDMVIFITASSCQNDQKLQQTIANRLKVEIEAIKDSTDEVARKIHEELNDKKFLLILDGVVDLINLQQLGIPNNDNGSKVVLASQFLHVCSRNNMDRSIEVERLQVDEAWQMFRDVVGPVINRPGILQTARRVCNKCSRLPLLIYKIASSFKLKGDAPSWRAALEDLDKRLSEHRYDVLEELYSFLSFCYGQLQDEHQKCFLYTSLYPAESKVYINYLVECWAAQGFLGDVDETRRYQRARDNGHMIIGDLVNVSLLEKGEQMIYVTMNSCMRQLALHILSTHPQYSSYVQTNEEFKEPPKSKTWVNAKWVSMIDTKLHDLPTSQDYSVLETLLLQKNSALAVIPPTFFEHMSNLLVLNLYGTGIKKLPSSISKLTDLKALYLNACKQLSQFPSEVELLQHLEVLDIRGSQVGFIPSCIGTLANLRCLRLPYKKNGNQSDHQDVISKLQNLEELVIEVISYEEWCNQAENVMKQLALLKCLTTLNCSFPSSSILMRSLIAKREEPRDQMQFTSFQFFIGCQNTEHPQILQYFKDGISKCLKYCNGKKDDVEIGKVLHQTEAIELISHKNITNLSDLGIENLNNIRGLLIEDCNQISIIVDGDKNDLRSGSILRNLEQLYLRNLPKLEYVFRGPLSFETFCQLHTLELENCSNLKSIFSREAYVRNDGTRNASIFPNLEKLYLKSIPDLKCVFTGPLPSRSFSKLQILALENCTSLKSIFSHEAIQNFSELQKLKVQGCSNIEELIMGTKDTERGKDVLLTLEKLELANLLNLKFICKTQLLAWSSLEVLKVHDCPNLKSLPFQKDKTAKLKCIKGKQEWWNELGKTNKEVHQQFQDIFVATDG